MLKGTDRNVRKKLNRMLAVLLTLLLVIGVMTAGVSASEADRMPALDPTQECSLKVTMTYTDPNLTADNVKQMPNVAVKIAKVADVTVNGGSADYKLLDQYSAAGVNLQGMTASETNEAAAALAALAAGSDVQQAVTGADGTVTFSNLDPGMYLIFQDKDANTAHRVDAISTMLLAVPFPVVGTAGNSWQYAVEAAPKTELPGPRNNGVIRVTKQLFDSETQLAYNPPVGSELIFYVGLFTDEACTVRAEGTTDMPLRFVNSDTAEAVFENLVTDQTYYIAETDGNGTVVPSVLKGEDILFVAEYPNGQTVSITRQDPEAELLFRNVTTGLPMGFYYGGTLTITKKTVMNGADYPMKSRFYAGIFTDPAYTDRLGTVLELNLDGQSTASVSVEINIGESADDSATFYVTETDKNGTPIVNDGSLGFVMTLNKPDGKVILSPASPDDEVIITNTFEEEPETEYEEETEEEIIEEETETETEARRSVLTPRTGDDTPIILYAGLMAAALVLMIITVIFQRRRVKR